MNSQTPNGSKNPSKDADPARWMASDSLADALGIEYHFAPAEAAPPVNEELIRAYVRRELNEPGMSETEQAIATFRSWHEAWCRISAEESGG